MDLVPHTNEETEMLKLMFLEASPSEYSQHFFELLGEKEKRVDVIIRDSNCSVWVTELKL